MELTDYLLLLSCGFYLTSAAEDPIITLNHGGQLQGKRIVFNNTDVDLFLGIRYAQAPLGNLRFEKPQKPVSWSGVQDAKFVGNVCAQLLAANRSVFGDEDCLFLDISVPGGVAKASKKPVMLFIHGGGYISGAGTYLLAPPLAAFGDVIVVTINYRLNILGFLSNGPGSGNFGLWDQRAAIVWVKENIAQFGGDPDLITIFGESAGGASVACQVMGKHNSGLFKRAIQESGSVYQPWGWFLSDNKRYKINREIREKTGCDKVNTVYDCLRLKSTEEVVKLVVADSPLLNNWHPVPDEDFFHSNISNEDYDLSSADRFDLMSGFNSQEGGLMLNFHIIVEKLNDTGVSMELARKILNTTCSYWTPFSVSLCIDFITDLYGLDTASDGQDRARRLSDFDGDGQFAVDIVRQLSKRGDNSTTYAYYFSESYQAPAENRLWNLPAWAQTGSQHTDELPFVFGMSYLNKDMDNFTSGYFGGSMPPIMDQMINWFKGAKPSDKPLSGLLMTAWTNFAKTGDPNLPTPLPMGAPAWPQYKADNDQFMELNSVKPQVISTPFKDRLERLNQVVFTARTAQIAVDKSPVYGCTSTQDSLSIIG